MSFRSRQKKKRQARRASRLAEYQFDPNSGYGGFGVNNQGYSSNFSAPGSQYNPLMQAYQSAYNKSNKANERRYGDILSGYQARYQAGMNELGNMAYQDTTDANTRYDQMLQSQMGDLNSRGLGNTTVRASAQQNNMNQRSDELRRLGDMHTQQRMQYGAGLSQEMLGFMERRNDQQPDVGLMAQAAQQQGTAVDRDHEMLRQGYNRHPDYGWYRPG